MSFVTGITNQIKVFYSTILLGSLQSKYGRNQSMTSNFDKNSLIIIGYILRILLAFKT
jgi:hypothetical protein